MVLGRTKLEINGVRGAIQAFGLEPEGFLGGFEPFLEKSTGPAGTATYSKEEVAT
jgi:hypothetical protein